MVLHTRLSDECTRQAPRLGYSQCLHTVCHVSFGAIHHPVIFTPAFLAHDSILTVPTLLFAAQHDR